MTDDSTHLPDEFWGARPELEHIRQAAWSRRMPPDTVFAALLARMASTVPPTAKIDVEIGEAKPPSMFVVLASDSGLGKSGSASVARMLYPIDEVSHPRTRIGYAASGEGLIECYLEPPQRGATSRSKIYDGLYVYIDEGSTWIELGSRNGNSVHSIARSLWSCEDLGQSLADSKTSRSISAGSYTIGMTMAIQPRLAGPLLDSVAAAAGTPQRFLWFNATDPTAPESKPEWPGPLELWEPSGLLGDLRQGFRVDPSIVDRFDRRRLQMLRGEIKPDPLDSHRRQNQIRVAGLLALLGGRAAIDPDDWDLAGSVMNLSDAVRSNIEETIAAEASWKYAKRREERVRTEVETADALDDREAARIQQAIASAGRQMRNRITRDGPLTRTAAKDAMSSRLRQYITKGDALREAVELGYLVEHSDGLIDLGPFDPEDE